VRAIGVANEINPNPFTPPKKKISVFWWIGAVLALLMALFFVQLFGPSPRIVVSKSTTYVTEPLLSSGLPDYEAYFRQKLREGVTAENNAAVLLSQALWSPEFKDDEYELVVTELGLDGMPSSETAMQSMYNTPVRERVLAWLKPQYAGPDGSGVTPDPEAVIDATLSHPWTAQQVPPMAERVATNAKPLDLMVEASRRPRYYWPSPLLLDDKQDMLATSALPVLGTMRDGARGLEVRAMNNIGENRLPEAWQDILTIYRLSGLMTQNGTLVDQLVAIAIRGMGDRAAMNLLNSPNMTKELARQIRSDLAALPAVSTTADSMNNIERLISLDEVVHIKTNGLNQVTTGDNSTSPVEIASIDWNIVLEKVNATFDDMVAAMQQSEAEKRAAALKDFELELNAEQDQAHRPGTWAAALFSRTARSDLTGKIVVGMLLPAMQAANQAEERTRATFAMTQLAAALAEYRAVHGKYPAKLDDITPDILAEVPTDVYHSKPYIYRRIDDGYLLYTVGGNGKDDGGSNERTRVFEGQEVDEMDIPATEAEGPPIPSGADDFSIRMPMPKFKLPKAAAGE